MSNLASALKLEVLRLVRKELRKELEGLKKASSQYRSDIAGLKRRVADLEKQQARLEKRGSRKAEPEAEGGVTARIRFSAQRFASQRQKLGFSAPDLGALLGVSAQTVYNWEAEKSRPRQAQLVAIAALRGIGKRQARARLEALAGR